jgi:hypothetical protein
MCGNPMLVETYLASLTTPAATYHALDWLQRRVKFDLGTQDVPNPAAAASRSVMGAGAKQAVVAEPQMLFTLGKKARDLDSADDHR